MNTRELFTQSNNYIWEPNEEITIVNLTGGKFLLKPGLQMKAYDEIFGIKFSTILDMKVDIINSGYYIRLI